MREIVTLQLGHLSNYTATHFWNTQESYFTYSQDRESLIDHDIHWRQGVASDGSDTFLPRTVIYDLKGGFGSLRKINALYETEVETDHLQLPSSSSVWSGNPVLQKQQPLEPSTYQQSLESGTEAPQLTKSTVRYWSDFSRVFYHPKSLAQLYDFELDSSIRPFERFSMGAELFQSLDKEDDILDRDFRPFVEECDMMQGIQTMATLDDAWGGFAAKYLDVLRDEYPKSCIWLWGLQSPSINTPREKRQLRLSNIAQSVAEASSSASMVVPIAIPDNGFPPNTAVDPASPWHVSAAYATAIETATLRFRLRETSSVQPWSMWNAVEGLNTGGNQTLAGLRLAVGSAAGTLDDENDGIDFLNFGRPSSLTEKQRQRGRVFGQLSLFRGTRSEETSNQDEDTEPNPRGRRLVGNTVYQSHDCPLQFPLIDSFPHIFTEVEDESELSVQTVLSTTKSISSHLKALKTQTAWSIPLDERETLSNTLAEVADAYEDDWSSGSDEDDD